MLLWMSLTFDFKMTHLTRDLLTFSLCFHNISFYVLDKGYFVIYFCSSKIVMHVLFLAMYFCFLTISFVSILSRRLSETEIA